jgi:N-acetyl-anhydromuramyl-L-alanine amidase AmpD
VAELQERLRELGFDAPGQFGASTEVAVKRFQESRGLLPDGLVGPRTREALAEDEPDEGDVREPEEGEVGPPIDRTLRLPEGQFFQAAQPKDLIVLHHTVGASARSTFDHWSESAARIATAYLVERDGVIHEVFDPRFWAFHLGLAGTGGRVDRRSIGIELASEGPLEERDGGFFAFGRPFQGTVFEHGSSWRDQGRFWAAYTQAQLESAIALVDHLCRVFGVPRRTPADPFAFDPALFDFRGVVAHHQLRLDKSDLHPGFPWDDLMERCRLEAV